MRPWHVGIVGLLVVPTAALAIVDRGHRIAAPRTEEDQEGFVDAKVSPDGQTVGWLAETGNCCTSYPLPTVLVLYRDGKVVRRVPMAPPIFEWAFGPRPGEVVTRQQYPHGPEYFTFTRIRVRDGKVLAEYRCNQEDPRPDPRPKWSRVIATPCPAYRPPPPEGAA